MAKIAFSLLGLSKIYILKRKKQDSKKTFPADFLQTAEPFHWTFLDLCYLTLPQPAAS